MVKVRSIPLAVIFSIITCGIYSIYWMIMLNDDVNRLADEPQATTGGMVVLLSIITCGIYGIYWNYKMGERCDKITGTAGNKNIVFLILCLFGLSIINFCMMQSVINSKAA